MENNNINSFLPKDLLNDINDIHLFSNESLPSDESTTSKSHSDSLMSNDNIPRSIPFSNISPFLSLTNPSLIDYINTFQGSQHMQSLLPFLTNEHIHNIINTLSPKFKETMCNCYGNYFLQKFILKLTTAQRLFILKKIRNNFIPIAKTISGTHCIQSLIDMMNTKKEEKIIKNIIKHNLLDLSLNPSSTQIIQKLITNIFIKKRDYLVQFILLNFVQLSVNLNGVALIKKFISEIRSSNDPKLAHIIIQLLENNCLSLCKDQYSNYVIQHSIEAFGYELMKKLIYKMVNNIIMLSLEKYSSNVIDKVMMLLKLNDICLFERVISFLFFNDDNFNLMINGKFSQFVIINILKQLPNNMRAMIKNYVTFKYGNEINHRMKIIKYLL